MPRVVTRDLLTAASALLSLSANASVIVGTAIGGVLATWPGPQAVYVLDTVSFAVSLGFLVRLGPLPAAEAGGDAPARGLRTMPSGIGYARRRPELIGSYAVDLAAMTFAFPNALFPFMAADLHAPWAVGLMFAAVLAVVGGTDLRRRGRRDLRGAARVPGLHRPALPRGYRSRR